MVNNFLPVMLVYTVTQLPFATWMLRSYFDSIPRELDEAATMDGCSPLQVLFTAERSGGAYLSAVFDYGSYVCQFETGVDAIPRFDGHLEVYGTQKIGRIQYDTPYVRNLPIRLFVTESNGRGGVERIDSHPSWGDPFVAEWNALYDNVAGKGVPKTGPEDFVQDLELFCEMARLMREPNA